MDSVISDKLVSRSYDDHDDVPLPRCLETFYLGGSKPFAFSHLAEEDRNRYEDKKILHQQTYSV